MGQLSGLKLSFIAGTLGQGGAERQLYYMVRAAHEAGAAARVLCLTRGEFWEKELRDLGVPVTWVGDHESKLVRVHRIVKELRSDRPRVIQSQHFHTNLYAASAARLLGLREIGAIRSDATSEVQRHGAMLGRLSLHSPRLIAANSRAGIRNAMAMGVPAARLRFLPNVVDTNRFYPAIQRRPGPVRLLASGRLAPEKRIDRFLSVLASLRRHSVEFQALIVGDGPLKPQLERQASDLGLTPDWVEFRGAVADTAPAYREADLLILTSDWEGTPNVLLEAMASGLPVVATPVGGVPDLVRHGETGCIVDCEAVEMWVARLRRLIEDVVLRREWGARAREYVLAHHSSERLADHLTELYQEVLS
jgi:glycosyltransferase involved in cell wall biosynthesis